MIFCALSVECLQFNWKITNDRQAIQQLNDTSPNFSSSFVYKAGLPSQLVRKGGSWGGEKSSVEHMRQVLRHDSR